jgi:hypothetical protein
MIQKTPWDVNALPQRAQLGHAPLAATGERRMARAPGAALHLRRRLPPAPGPAILLKI